MDAEAALAEDIDLVSLWRRLADDPDSPDRFEITEHGKIVPGPAPTPLHQTVIVVVMEQLKAQLGGRALPEVAMLTRTAGIRRPDVVWLPQDRLAESRVQGPMETAPPLVAEIVSPGNRKAEILHKIRAYLDSGVQEIVTVGLDGTVTFHRADGAHARSALGVKLDLPPELFGR